jgi:hypothetical protein
MTDNMLYIATQLSKKIADLQSHYKEIELELLETKKKPEDRNDNLYYINTKYSICIPTLRNNYASEIKLRTDFIDPVELTELYLQKVKAKLKELTDEFESL